MFDETRDGHLLSRRTLLRGAAGVGRTAAAAAAAVLPACGSQSGSGVGSGAADEDPPEIATIRLMKSPPSCYAAQALAADFLIEEWFTDVQYLESSFTSSSTR